MSFCLSTKFGASLTKFAVPKQISEYVAMLQLQYMLDYYKILENLDRRKALLVSQPHKQLQLVLRAEDKMYRTLEFASAVAHETTCLCKLLCYTRKNLNF